MCSCRIDLYDVITHMLVLDRFLIKSVCVNAGCMLRYFRLTNEWDGYNRIYNHESRMASRNQGNSVTGVHVQNTKQQLSATC